MHSKMARRDGVAAGQGPRPRVGASRGATERGGVPVEQAPWPGASGQGARRRVGPSCNWFISSCYRIKFVAIVLSVAISMVSLLYGVAVAIALVPRLQLVSRSCNWSVSSCNWVGSDCNCVSSCNWVGSDCNWFASSCNLSIELQLVQCGMILL